MRKVLQKFAGHQFFEGDNNEKLVFGYDLLYFTCWVSIVRLVTANKLLDTQHSYTVSVSPSWKLSGVGILANKARGTKAEGPRAEGFISHYIILNNGILKSYSLICPRSKGYITQYTP